MPSSMCDVHAEVDAIEAGLPEPNAIGPTEPVHVRQTLAQHSAHNAGNTGHEYARRRHLAIFGRGCRALSTPLLPAHARTASPSTKAETTSS